MKCCGNIVLTRYCPHCGKKHNEDDLDWLISYARKMVKSYTTRVKRSGMLPEEAIECPDTHVLGSCRGLHRWTAILSRLEGLRTLEKKVAHRCIDATCADCDKPKPQLGD